jgi:2-dehydro-3-deoxygluconokinase
VTKTKKMIVSKQKGEGLAIALFGECMVELQEIEQGRVQQTFGGDTLNAAIYMARLGKYLPAQVDYVTALGCDSFSDRMVAFWEGEGVGSDLVLRQPGEMPGLYYIHLDEHGERHFSYWRGQAAVKKCFEYESSQEILAALGRYDVIYLSGISIAVLNPVSRNRLFKRLVELAATGTRICLDYNYRPHLWSSSTAAREAYELILPCCDTVFVGLDELIIIHGASSQTDGHHYLETMGVRESVVRSGADPCSIWVDGQHCEIEAVQDVHVVDTTAAGDSFSAAYLLARNSGYAVRQAARIAHRMAAYVIGHKGAIAPIMEMPGFDDLLE